jgi:AcrR family transcriptional regulator
MPHPRHATGTKADILDSALTMFLARGYDATSLEQIGEPLGLTRQAVLYHFHSKEELLAALVEPTIDSAGRIVESWEERGVTTRADRRDLITALVDNVAGQQRVAALLIRFTNEAEAARIAPILVSLSQRVAALLTDPARADDPATQVRALAAMGAMNGPIGARVPLALDDPAVRQALVDACLAALG